MEQEYGKEKSTALAKLPMRGALTQPQAEHILSLVYPNVPKDEVIRCAILCRDFGLHPLMKEVYILGFQNRKTGKTDYSTVIGITANRKMAADKKGAFSFLDDTPRAASKEEIVKQYGQNSEEERDNLISFTKLKGEKGNEATGFGLWPKGEEPYGTNKGNTKRNMANIRSERQALDRLPGEVLPLRDVEVIDAAYAEVPDIGEAGYKVVVESTGEIKEDGSLEPEDREPPFDYATQKPQEHWCEEHNCPFEKKVRGSSTWWAHKLPDGSWCNEAKKKDNASKQAPKSEPYIPENTEDLPSDEPEPEPVEKVGFIDMDWLKESLAILRAAKLSAWSESNLLAYMQSSYKTDGKTVLECAAQLGKGEATHFVRKVQDTLDMA